MSGNSHVRRSAMFRSAVFVVLLWGLKQRRRFGGLRRCFRESRSHPRISVKVTSPFGNTLHHQENATHGQFAFTTKEAGNYLACFSSDGHYEGAGELSVNIDWKTGIAAKDWESVARKEKIEGVELELRKLEGAVEAIHENLLYLKDREAELRTTSENTNARVAWFSIMSLGICISVSDALSMGKNEEQDLRQREQSIESGDSEGNPGRFWIVLSRFSNEFSFRCVFVLFLGLSVLLPGIFWLLPSRSVKSGFDAKEAIKLSAPAHAYFTLGKPVSELVRNIEKLEYDIFEEIGVPDTKVAILSMHQSGASNSTYVVFGVLPDPVTRPINNVSLSVLKSSLIELFLRHSNLTLTTTIFGRPSGFEILKFPGGITVTPLPSASIWQKSQILFNFTLNNSISEIDDKFVELMDQLKYGLKLRSYENLFVQLTNRNGSTTSSPIIVQASVMSDGFGSLLPQRLKQLAQTITGSPAKNLGLNNSVFGKVKSISLSSYLKDTLHPTPSTPSPAPSPGPSMSRHPTFSPTHSPGRAPAPKIPHLTAAPPGHVPIHSPGPGSGSYPTFPPLISPEPSSSATHLPPPCPYSHPAIPPRSSPRSHSSRTSNHPPLMSPRSKLSPDQPPLPSVSYSSRPGQGMDSTKGSVYAPHAQSPPAQSPLSIAADVLPKELWLSAFLGFLTFHLHL
ncbi:hypothetical protein V6N11_019793 [Hibiscus sabdariffa]|uniref:GOLD domain-containing protein n=1 Tax=Hibiscus sabdariffa TaxID=183260 RepID=A0ABR1ZQD2_9ROSI